MVDSPWTKLDDDVIFLIFAALPIPDLYAFSKVCRQTWQLSHQRNVWVNACKFHILQEGISFPRCCLPFLPDSELRARTIRAGFLAQNLRSPSPKVRRIWTVDYQARVIQAKFLKIKEKTWIIMQNLEHPRKNGRFTLSLVDCTTSKVACNYELGNRRTGLITNSNPHGSVMVMVNTTREKRYMIELLSIREAGNAPTMSFERVHTVDSTSWGPDPPIPIALHGDMIGTRVRENVITIQNLKTEEQFFLNHRNPVWLRHHGDSVAFFHENFVLFLDFCGGQTFIRQPGGFVVARERSQWYGDAYSCTFEPMLSCQDDGPPRLASLLVAREKELRLFKVNGSPNSGRRKKDNKLSLPPLFSTSVYPVPWMVESTICGPAGSAAYLMNSKLMMVAFPGPYNKTTEVQLKVNMDLYDYLMQGHDTMWIDYDEMEGHIIAYTGDSPDSLMMYSLCPLDCPLSET